MNKFSVQRFLKVGGGDYGDFLRRLRIRSFYTTTKIKRKSHSNYDIRNQQHRLQRTKKRFS